MDLEEFHESDVIFSSHYSLDHRRSNENENGSNVIINSRHCYDHNKKREKQQRMSSPMSMPVNIANGTGFCRYDIDVARSWPSDQSSDDDDDDDQMVERLPPHLIVERRVSGEIARSFSPLKGRNLSQVRDSILRMTGFLEI